MLAYISGEAFEEDKPVSDTQLSTIDGQQETEDDLPPPVPAKDDKTPSVNAIRTPAPKATTFAEQVAAMPKQTPEEQELARKRLKYGRFIDIGTVCWSTKLILRCAYRH